MQQGHEFPVSIGTLKFPLEGITAYYAPRCVGNIISEPLFRQVFQVEDIRAPDSRNDIIKSWRFEAGPVLKWSRGIEGVFITDLRQHIGLSEAVLSVIQGVPIHLDESDKTVESWLIKLGLTAREALVTLGLREMCSSEMRDEVLTFCLRYATQNDKNFAYVLERFNESVAVWKRTEIPNVDTYRNVIESLRNISITNPVKKGRVEDGVSCYPADCLVPRSGVQGDPVSKVSLPTDTSRCGVEFEDETREASLVNTMFEKAAITTAVTLSHKIVPVSADSVRADELKAAKMTAETQDPRIFSAKANGAEDSLLSLWIYQSKLTLSEILTSKFVTMIGLSSERKIVALSLAQQGFSKTRIKGISRVEELHKLTSFIGRDTLSKMIKNNTVKHLDGNLTAEDVDNYSKFVHDTECSCN